MLLTPHLILYEQNGRPVSLRKSGIFGQSIYIVPRSQCSFRRVGMVNKGSNATKAVLLRLKKEALSSDSYFKIVPDKRAGRAGAWEFPKTGPNVKLRYLPESLARQPLTDGARLVKCVEGFEGQIWDKDNLISSRWWLDSPAKKQWLAFIRAAETEVDISDTEVPLAQEVAFRRDIPIWDVSRDRLEQIFSPSTLLIGGMTGLFCFSAYFSSQLAHHWFEIKRHTQKIESISEQTEIVISHRNKAIRNIKSAQRFERLGQKGDVIIALSQVIEAIKSEDVKLNWVRYNDGSLEVGLATFPEEDGVPMKIPALVENMEAKSALKNVNILASGEKLLTINLEIDLGLGISNDLSIGR